MNTRCGNVRTSRVLAALALAAFLAVFAGPSRAESVPGISGDASCGAAPCFSFDAGAGELGTPDGGSIHFWGYRDTTGAANPFNVPQYPGPTLIVTQGDTVQITLTSNLPFGKRASIVFPGHNVTATGGTAGLLTQESTGSADTVTYTFIAAKPGTYMYHSGTEMELQVEMGLVGAIIVRPNGVSPANRYAYNDVKTKFDHEHLFLLTSIDPTVHQLAEQGRFAEIDMTTYWPVYWFINGRAAPDVMAMAFVSWLPHQPYNSMPRMTPGQKILMRIVGAGQGQHPFHFHGNNADLIARDGRLLAHPVSKFTTLSVPGETVDQIFTWTGAKLGWDIYGTPADGMPVHACTDLVNNETGVAGADGYADVDADHPWEYCGDHYGTCTDGNNDGLDDATLLRCKNGYTKAFPVVLPEKQNLTFGGWWSGSPFMGASAPLPPGEGGLNPNSGYFFMWHSHTEKELTNFDIFPGGMMSMMVVEPPGTTIP
jgi:hypothetical protein